MSLIKVAETNLRNKPSQILFHQDQEQGQEHGQGHQHHGHQMKKMSHVIMIPRQILLRP